MKIALVHDYIKEYGGAERVLEALHEVWPEASVYTSVYLPEFLGPHRERFKNWKIRESWVKYIPFKEKLISPLRLITPLLFKQFDFSEFDVVIVSATGAYSPNSITCHPELVSGSHIAGKEMPKHLQCKQVRHDKGKRPIHICYCHTPPRYLYGYATAREWKKNIIFRILGEAANHFLRLVDYRSAQNVDYFIANSENIKERIKKFYRKEATVIYPPVNTAFSSLASSVQLTNKILNVNKLDARRYFLAGGRLARPKHIDLIVRVCQELNLPLKVFGRDFAGYGEELKPKKPFYCHLYCHPEFISGSIEIPKQVRNDSFRVRNDSYGIEFLGEVTDEEKFELMRNAKAYIFASEDEDFGITPVEAMACGTPVIAYRSGGVKESVVEGKTGVFFDQLTVESLSKAIKHFNNIYHLSGFKSGDCIEQAQKFSKERFKREIKTFVESRIKNHESRSHNS